MRLFAMGDVADTACGWLPRKLLPARGRSPSGLALCATMGRNYRLLIDLGRRRLSAHLLMRR